MVELGFWETFAIVISPIIIGAISTHFLSQSWQNYKHKIQLKQELIQLYHESIHNDFSSNVILVYQIAVHYSVTEDLVDIEQTGTSLHTFNIPTEKLNQPAHVFKKEFKEYLENLKQLASKKTF